MIERNPTAPSLLAAVAILAAAAAGCGSGAGHARVPHDDPHPLPQDTLTVRTTEIGSYGGRFVIGQTAEPKTFNAIMANETSSTDITNLLFTTLSDYDNMTQLEVPALAKSWETSPDGLTWTWHLRRGARFSDGHPITSADVLFSFLVAYDDVLHPSIQDLLVVAGKRIEVSAPDSYTVVTRIAGPFAMIVPAVGALRIMPKHVLEEAFHAGDFASRYGVNTPPDEIVTSGAWRVKSYVPGEKTVLTRNPYWYGVDREGNRLPYLDELVFVSVPDQNAAALKFQAGELDALRDVKAEDYATYEAKQKENDYTLYSLGAGLNTNFLWFNLNRKGKDKTGAPHVGAVKYAWFEKADFRRAVSMAIDREAIIRGAYHGHAVKNWSVLTESSKQWHRSAGGTYDHDPERAKRMLDALGYVDRDGDGVREDEAGHPIRFGLKTNSGNTTRVAVANFVSDDLASVGIACTPTPVEFNTLVSNLRQDFQYDAILLGLGSAVPSDPGMAGNVWRSSGLTHYWNVKQTRPATEAEARIDRLFEQQIASNDRALRLQIWYEIDQIAEDECFFIWLPVQIYRVPVSNRFGNVEPTIIPHEILWNIDRVFLKPSVART
jgi:peptide/nickel transport system substrate-binding protein